MSTDRMLGRKAPLGAKCRWRRSCKYDRRNTRHDIQRTGNSMARQKERQELRKDILNELDY